MLCSGCGIEVADSARFCSECGTRVAPPESDEAQLAARSTSASPPILTHGGFVGRQRELGDLMGAWEQVSAGHVRISMLVGEPGIGKTRTAEQFSGFAAANGAQVLWGRCHEQPGMPSYWPWIQIIRSLLQGKDAEKVAEQIGLGAAAIAEIVPELQELIPNLRTGVLPEVPEQARFQLFDAIASFLKANASQRPLVLMLDNLHWADRPSLLLLEYLAQEVTVGQLMVIGTYRDVDLSRQHPLSEALGELSRARGFQRIPLRGMTPTEVAGFIEATTSRAPENQFVEVLHSHTEGNPLFLTELVRMLEQEGQLSSDTAGQADLLQLRIPEGIREVIGRRLNRLSQGCNQVLTVASALGREFQLTHLAKIQDELTQEELFNYLEEAASGRIVEEVGRTVGCYQFTHALIQQTLMDELTTSRRVRLSARIVAALEELYAADPTAYASLLAYHAGEAEPIIGSSKLVHYSLLSGGHALATFAYEDAILHYQRGLAAKEGQPMDTETAQLLFGLGRAQAATAEVSQLQQAVFNLSRSFEFFAQNRETEQAVAVAEYPLTLLPGSRTGMSDLIKRALALVDENSPEAARLLSQYIRALVMEEGDYERAQEAFPKALEIARRIGDEALEMKILTSATVGDVQYLRLQGSTVKSLRAIELAEKADDPRTEVDARYFSSMGLWSMGHLGELRSLSQGALAPANQLQDRYALTGALWCNEVSNFLCGDWLAATNFNRQALAVCPRDPRPLFTGVILEAEQGNSEASQERLQEFLSAVNGSPPAPISMYAWASLTLPMLARINGTSDHLELAEKAGKTVLSSNAAIPYVAAIARAGLGLAAAMTGNKEEANRQYQALESGAGIPLPATFMAFVRFVPGSYLCVARLLGLIADSLDLAEKSLAHLERSVNFCRDVGCRSELAWSLYDYCRVSSKKEANGQSIPEKLQEAEEICTQLGMVPLQGKIRDLQVPKTRIPPVAKSYPDGLTQREIEVLQLLATGRTDRQIAEELVISVGTASTHVRNILNKTGSANRTEATAYAARQGLL